MIRIWRQLNPQTHLAAAVGWVVMLVVLLPGLLVAWFAAQQARELARTDTEQLLRQFATQIRAGVADKLNTRLSIMQTTVAQIEALPNRSLQTLRGQLDALQGEFPEFSWVGIANARGQVLAAGGGLLVGADVSGRPWFQRGRAEPMIGNVHTAQLLADLLAPDPDGLPIRFIDIAMPVLLDGETGVLGAHLSSRWIENLKFSQLRSLQTDSHLEMLVFNEEGKLLSAALGPNVALPKNNQNLTVDGRYLIGSNVHSQRHEGGLNWTVVVRQKRDEAMALPDQIRRNVMLTSASRAAISALVAALLTWMMLRRLTRLNREAAAVRLGNLTDFSVPAGRDEIAQIGGTMASLVSGLRQERANLKASNATLDARVAERGARIERLSETARRASVTRERLKMSRDLHDTLAHSLMALLTQIRVIRKLGRQMPESELEQELAQAEDVAASGLSEARWAIANLRNELIRDDGLGSALQELGVRFAQRNDILVQCDLAPEANELNSERAETVYRMAQEALRNIERHAQASKVTIILTKSDRSSARAAIAEDAAAIDEFRLEIIDDGAGFDHVEPVEGHYGMAGMHEQAELIEAQLRITSEPGQGTRIEILFRQ